MNAQIAKIAASRTAIGQGRAIGYLSGRIIYGEGMRLRHQIMTGDRTPLAFFTTLSGTTTARKTPRKTAASTKTKTKRTPKKPPSPPAPWTP
jgi:hypothetical protein